jgi:hypothetical protein
MFRDFKGAWYKPEIVVWKLLAVAFFWEVKDLFFMLVLDAELVMTGQFVYYIIYILFRQLPFPVFYTGGSRFQIYICSPVENPEIILNSRKT